MGSMRNEKGTERSSKKTPGKKTAVVRRTDVAAPLSPVPHPADAEELGLSDEEILLYRRRVAEGMYNTREVADEVARRMLKRGDV
jgi:hypothetical protein